MCKAIDIFRSRELETKIKNETSFMPLNYFGNTISQIQESSTEGALDPVSKRPLRCPAVVERVGTA